MLEPATRIPYLRPIRRQALDLSIQRNGAIVAPMLWSFVRDAELQAFILMTWGDWTTASKPLYASWLGEDKRFNPYAVTLERPLQGEHYTLQGIWARELRIPGYGWTLQRLAKSANYTVTASDRLIDVDTSGGDVTLTLPSAATPQPYTIFSFVKTSASNNLVLDPNGSELIDGAATKTITSAGRTDIYSTGTAWRTL